MDNQKSSSAYHGIPYSAPKVPHQKNGADKSVFTRLLAADQSGMSSTFAFGLTMMFITFIAGDAWMPRNSWGYEFLFHRSFVQWILLGAFFIGIIHLIRRTPEWNREKKALRMVRISGYPGQGTTMVQRRWLQIQNLADSHHGQVRHASKALADHDEAEVDAAYRLTSDIVQVLPLIGFFGTVFGLSKGLYQSFLASGGATTKDFAKAIAIAFDNTLLGLGLTISLFICVSLLRKREDAMLLKLNLLAETWLPHNGAAVAATPGAGTGGDIPEGSAHEPAHNPMLTLAASIGQIQAFFVGDQPTESLQQTLARLTAQLAAVNHSLARHGQDKPSTTEPIAMQTAPHMARRGKLLSQAFNNVV